MTFKQLSGTSTGEGVTLKQSTVCVLILLLLTTSAASSKAQGFIENRGQVDEDVLFYAAGNPRVSIYFTKDAVVLDLSEEPEEDGTFSGPNGVTPGHLIPNGHHETPSRRGCAVWIRFDGANPNPSIDVSHPLFTRYNYFLGNDPAEWQTDVPAYSEIRYRSIWPGTDLAFREEGGELAYELIRSPRAEGHVRFRYEGGSSVKVTADGSHRIETHLGTILDIRPGAGSDRGAIVLERSCADLQGEISNSDPRDPDVHVWSTLLGGSGDDTGSCLGIDASGNPVVTGHTRSSDFPTTPGIYDNSHNGDGDVFVAKLSPSGSHLLWSTFLGGASGERGLALVVNASGNIVVTGFTMSSDFPTTSGAHDDSYNGGADVFAAELSLTGSQLLWSTLLGGDGDDGALAINLDASGSPVLAGYTWSSAFPTTPGVYDRSYNGGGDVFVAKLFPDGSHLRWSTLLGGGVIDYARAVVPDGLGNLCISGVSESSDFPTTPGAYDESFNGVEDAIVAKLSFNGSDLLWSTFLGGMDFDSGFDLALDSSGSPVVTGHTWSSDFPTTPSTHDASYNGNTDVFVAKLSSSGSNLLWGTFLGGSSYDIGFALELDASGNPFVTGFTWSSDFPTTPGAYDDSYNGSHDVFVAELSFVGRELLWSTYLGGSQAEHGNALALDTLGNPFITGHTRSPDFPTTPGAYDESENGGFDVFLTKLVPLEPASAEDPLTLPASGFYQIAPNPLRPDASNRTVRISFGLPVDSWVRLSVFDVSGREVARLVDGERTAGYESIEWVPEMHTAGIYFCHLKANGLRRTKKILVLDSDRRP